jgi:hypothetical protein
MWNYLVVCHGSSFYNVVSIYDFLKMYYCYCYVFNCGLLPEYTAF